MTTVNLAVLAGNEDAYENDNGGSFSDTNDRILVRAGTVKASRFNIGMVFPNATVPAGATIDTCVLQPYAKTAGDQDMAGDIFFNDVDDAADFDTDADVTTRLDSAATAASVSWAEDGLDSPARYASSPDISVPCQEVIDRAGWASGQDLCVLIRAKDQASAKKFEGAAFEFTGATEPLLDIDYTAAAVDLPPGLGPAAQMQESHQQVNAVLSRY